MNLILEFNQECRFEQEVNKRIYILHSFHTHNMASTLNGNTLSIPYRLLTVVARKGETISRYIVIDRLTSRVQRTVGLLIKSWKSDMKNM